MIIALGIVLSILCVIFVGAALYSIETMGRVPVIYYSGEHWKDCPDCHGTGVIHKDDPYWECECPCDMVIE